MRSPSQITNPLQLTFRLSTCRFDYLASSDMSFNRAARRAAPLLLQRSLRTTRPLPSKIPAIAILLPHRHLSTETSTSGGGSGSGPPPGFSLDQAKKPLPEQRESAQKSKEGATSSEPGNSNLADHQIPRREPTALPKGEAAEAHSLSELAAEKSAAQKGNEKTPAKKKEEELKLTIWQKVKKEVAHYWDGTKLLAAEVRISSRLALKMAAGYELTRREHRQVCEHPLLPSNIAKTVLVTKNCSRSWSTGAIFRLRYRPIC
jgi:LETM1 and EF-hand domain-containing protein 1